MEEQNNDGRFTLRTFPFKTQENQIQPYTARNVYAHHHATIRVTRTRGAPETAANATDPAHEFETRNRGTNCQASRASGGLQIRRDIAANIPPQILMLLPRTCRRIDSVLRVDFETVTKYMNVWSKIIGPMAE